MKLLVRNLARTLDKAALEALFTPFGEVHSCNLVLDKETGGSKGFGFVEMPEEEHAQAAITALNGTKIEGNKIRVKLADEPKAQAEAPSSSSIWGEEE